MRPQIIVWFVALFWLALTPAAAVERGALFNGALAGKLAQLLADEENTVAAIGVLHLLGKNSVPELLRARGIEVERVY